MALGSSIHPQTESNESGMAVRKVVVGIDGSPASLEAMEAAAQEATLRGASLQVAMTWDWPLAYGRTPMLHESDPVGGARKEFEAAVASLKEAHPDLTIATLFEHGHPVPALVEASEGADLLVVGSRGHGEFVGMLLGSVSQHCAAQAHCPVLIHRTRR
jgi:nucleotide-binding universal stress UspA family protein